MVKRRGLFIVLEGTDGSGKTVQFKKLVRRLRASGFRVATFDFPQYGDPSSYFVREYLNGRYGTAREVGPYRASLFYALDRFHASEKIRSALQNSRIVVANRYVGSNLAHQGAKIRGPQSRRAFYQWTYELEYLMLGIPKPDLNLVLHVPAETAARLVLGKGKRKYLGGKRRDIHEADLKHLKDAERAYAELTRTFPKDFISVECVRDGKLLPPNEVHERVWQVVRKILY